MLPLNEPPVIQTLADDMFIQRGVTVFLRREDMNHPMVSGNKWRKLRYNLDLIREHKGVVTFGGAYSNHIYAAAAASRLLGIVSHGIIRGERAHTLSPTLEFAEHAGMKLHFATREEYRNKPALVEKFFGSDHGWHVLPEGGTNELAIKGCREMMDDSMASMDVVCCPVGTGGTMAGLISAGQSKILGFTSLKADLSGTIASLISDIPKSETARWELISDFHFGGYARVTDELIDFIRRFRKSQGVLLDPVYTGKMMYGLYEMIREGLFPPGTRICAIHTGGLQGWAGFRQRKGIDPGEW